VFEAVNNKLLEQFINNFSNLHEKENWEGKQLSFMLNQDLSNLHHLLVLLLPRNSKENLVIKLGRDEKILV